MDIVAKPSPPSPRPAKFGPLATKIEQFIARAMRVIVADVRRVDRRRVAEAVLGAHREVDRGVDVRHPDDRQHRHHLLGPDQAWSTGTSATSSRGSTDGRTPISARIRAASRPIQAGLMWPGLPGRPELREDHPLEAAQLVLREDVGAVLGHRPHEPVRDRRDRDRLLLVRAHDVVVERRAADDVGAGLLHVGGLVDDGRRVAGSGGDGALVGAQGLADDARAAGDQQQPHAPGGS